METYGDMIKNAVMGGKYITPVKKHKHTKKPGSVYCSLRNEYYQTSLGEFLITNESSVEKISMKHIEDD